MVYRQNCGHLPPFTITNLLCVIVTDAAQLFLKFPTQKELRQGAAAGKPTFMLAIQRSLLSENIHLVSMNIPKC